MKARGGKDYCFTIWQDNVPVASGAGADLEAVRREMVHYAAQYAEDGPIEIVASAELAPESGVLFRTVSR